MILDLIKSKLSKKSILAFVIFSAILLIITILNNLGGIIAIGLIATVLLLFIHVYLDVRKLSKSD